MSWYVCVCGQRWTAAGNIRRYNREYYYSSANGVVALCRRRRRGWPQSGIGHRLPFWQRLPLRCYRRLMNGKSVTSAYLLHCCTTLACTQICCISFSNNNINRSHHNNRRRNQLIFWSNLLCYYAIDLFITWWDVTVCCGSNTWSQVLCIH